MGNYRKCAVVGCADKTSHRHRFPNPQKNMTTFHQWVHACGNSLLGTLNPSKVYNSQRVCHIHFREEDRASNMYLQRGTVPRLLLPLSTASSEVIPSSPCKIFPLRTFSEHEIANKGEGLDQPSTSSTCPPNQLAVLTGQVSEIADMPGKRCSISTCNNSRVKTGNSVVYHSFPKTKNVRDIWIKKCRRGAKWNPNSGTVCSVHFKEDDYQRDLRAELLNLPRKPKLHPTAIPSLNLNSSTKKYAGATPNGKSKASSSCTQNPQTSDSIVQECNIFESAHEIVFISAIEQETEFDQKIETLGYPEIQTFSIDDEIKIEELDIGDNSFAVEVFQDFTSESTINANELQFADTSTQTDFDQLLENQKWFFQRINTLEKSLQASQNEAAGLRSKVAALEYELHKATAISKEHERLKEGIGNILTQSQIDYGVLKNTNVVWTPDDISKAFTIRYFNSRCYTYLRDTLKYPLPDVPSLQRWVSKINLKDGILLDVFRIMKIAGYAMTDFDKNVVLHFDEIGVRPVYEYDEIQDEILGPHQTMLVIMARGLFSDWKQPVYIGFDKKISEEVLTSVIEHLHEISYTVVACTSDCSKSNAELWKDLAVNPQEPFFLHPTTNSKIYFFVDSSYLLTLLHKWFVTTGFVLEDGAKVTKAPLRLLLDETGLTQKDLELEAVPSRNIQAARRVFSQTCAMGLKGSDSDEQVAGGFIEKISAWFDLVNANLGPKKPYGCDLEAQNRILDAVYHTVRTMRCTTKRNMLTFQRGLLISINSLKQLFNTMKRTCSANHILTVNLNLDSLDDLLSQVRGGEDSVPSPLESIRKIRNLLLGDDIGNISERDVLRNEYVLTKALTANVPISNPPLVEDDANSATCSTEQVFLNFLPAWVATKYKDAYPDLGLQLCKQNYVLPSWLREASSGNLIKPSEKWVRQTELINEIFSYHNESVFKKSKNATGSLIDIVIKQYGNMIPKEVISDFVRQRVLVNIRYRNVRLKLQVAGSKRKAVNADELVLFKNSKSM